MCGDLIGSRVSCVKSIAKGGPLSVGTAKSVMLFLSLVAERAWLKFALLDISECSPAGDARVEV